MIARRDREMNFSLTYMDREGFNSENIIAAFCDHPKAQCLWSVLISWEIKF